MENINSILESKFDAFINKTIILSSKEYFRKQMKYVNNEKYIIDNEDYCDYLENHVFSNDADSSIEHAELRMLLKSASSCLSTIEQAAINLLYKEQLKPNDVSKQLDVHAKSVSRIEKRGKEKLRKFIDGNGEF